VQLQHIFCLDVEMCLCGTFSHLVAVITDVRTFITKCDEEDLQALVQNIRLLKEQFEGEILFRM
jgi:hypothetical protein